MPVAALDACANLCRGLPLHGLLVGVGALFHAGGAGGSVGALEATVQAVVSQNTVAVAVAGFLMQHLGNFGGHLIYSHLVGVGEVLSGELAAAQNMRQWLAGWGGVVGGHVIGGVGPLCGRGHGYKSQDQAAKNSLHVAHHKWRGEGSSNQGRGVAEEREFVKGKKKGGMNGTLFMPGGQ